MRSRALLQAILLLAGFILAIGGPSPAAQANSTGAQPVVFTLLYDNRSNGPFLQSDWGFSCLVESGDDAVLFDTGADGQILLANMAVLGKDPARITRIVISHDHPDHTGGLRALLDAGASPVLYVPSGSAGFGWSSLRDRVTIVEISEPTEILPGFIATGPAGGAVSEQALAVRTEQGLVVVTGCAHPGAARLVRLAQGADLERVHLLVGGLHMDEASDWAIASLAEELHDLGVEQVAPAHCTGARAIAALERSYESSFQPAGAGTVFTLFR